jgi:hypothetical protein
VQELWILSSRGGASRDRGATKAKITFIAESGQREEQIVALYEYPNWTVIAARDVSRGSRIQIQALDYVGEGPAIAGIRAFNRRW